MAKKCLLFGVMLCMLSTSSLKIWGQKGLTPVTINFTYWAGADAENAAFDSLIAKFQKKYPYIIVNKQGGAFKDFYTRLETRIAGNDAPDVTRIQYQQVGRYASNNVLLNLSKRLNKNFSQDFNQALWNAVTYKGSVYALPHHTDTMAVFYNQTYFDQLGIKVPDKLENAWTWEEFISIAKRVQNETNAEYGFAINWTNGNGYRWLPFLYQKGGAILSSDLKKCVIDSPEALEAIKLTSGFFKERLIPAGTSIKGTENVNTLFATGVTGMLITGNWMIPYFEKNMTNFTFGVTYMPRGKSMASDLGGNALAVLKKTKHPEEALMFVKFMVEAENMKEFVEKGMFLPVRNSLSADILNYDTKPELMRLFVNQAKTIPVHMAKTVSLPIMSKINKVLADELELVFTQGKDEKEALKTMKDQIEKIIKESN